MKTLGERIKNLRIAKGWKQEKLAAESDTSKSYIYLLETNQRNKDTSAYKLKQVADALGTTIDYLLTGKETLKEIEHLEPELKEIYLELLDFNNLPFYRKSGELDTAGLKSILEFIRYIKQKNSNNSNMGNS